MWELFGTINRTLYLHFILLILFNNQILFQEVVSCGTEDVLTCHVIILREPSTGVTAIAHFDEFSRVWDFRGLMQDFIDKIHHVKHKSEWEYQDGTDEGDWEWWEDSDEDDNQAAIQTELDTGTINDKLCC